jgi:prevent-host-death family protein
MEASIRQLKANLSGYIRRAAAGETVTVSIHNRPVARIVSIRARVALSGLRRVPGVQWNGRKPAGLPSGEVLRKGLSLSKWVSEDRR